MLLWFRIIFIRALYAQLVFSGVSVPRMRSVIGGMLPSARVVSNYVHGTGVCDLVEPKNSAMLMQWGQLVGHDIADTPTLKGM